MCVCVCVCNYICIYIYIYIYNDLYSLMMPRRVSKHVGVQLLAFYLELASGLCMHSGNKSLQIISS